MDVRKLKREIWPHQIVLKGSREDVDIAKWCWANCGRRFQDWYGYDIGDGKRLYAFKDTETLLTFKLTWGNYVTR